jgi:hypothetical protein
MFVTVTDSQWDEGSITYNTAPPADGIPLVRVPRVWLIYMMLTRRYGTIVVIQQQQLQQGEEDGIVGSNNNNFHHSLKYYDVLSLLPIISVGT